jgi:hypothetical protein
MTRIAFRHNSSAVFAGPSQRTSVKPVDTDVIEFAMPVMKSSSSPICQAGGRYVLELIASRLDATSARSCVIQSVRISLTAAIAARLSREQVFSAPNAAIETPIAEPSGRGSSSSISKACRKRNYLQGILLTSQMFLPAPCGLCWAAATGRVSRLSEGNRADADLNDGVRIL